MAIKPGYVGKLNICNGPEGLTEPSGQTLLRDGKSLWTVSDDTRSVFKLDLEGRLIEGESLLVAQTGFEGISLDETGEYLYVVQEDGNVLMKYSLQSKNPVLSKRLSKLDGCKKVKRHFSAGKKNNGLEGITVNTNTGNLFLLKESNPALLLEITPHLERLAEYRKLTEKRGFKDNKLASKDIDYPGLSYDSTRDAFWIVSGKARRFYLYDWDADEVLFNKALKYTEGAEERTITNAEGIAYDGISDRLYIVSDEEARLYVYDVH